MPSEPHTATERPGLSRRRFLELGGLGGLSVAWARGLAASDLDAFGVRYNDPLQPLIFRVERAWDLLHLDVELINFMPVRTRGLRTNPNGPSGLRDEFTLQIASFATDGFVVLHLGGQHIAEQAIWDRPLDEKGKEAKRFPTYFLDLDDAAAPAPPGSDSGNNDLDFLGRDRLFEYETGVKKLLRPDPQMLHGLAGAWMAGHSQIVFRIPQRATPLPFGFDEIVRTCLESGELLVHPRVAAEVPDETFFTGSDSETIRLGRPYLGRHDTLAPHTQIEFPSMLYLSPYGNAQWSTRGGGLERRRSELWSLDLAPPSQGAETGGRPREQRAQGHLFAFDTDTSPPRWPLEGKYDQGEKKKYHGGERPKTSLYQATRELLVGQMGEDNGDIVAERFRLSALGASAKLKYRPLIVPALHDPTAEIDHDPRDEDSKGKITPRFRDGRSEDLISDKTAGERPGFLTEWDQRTESGRDYFVKEAFSGYWFPFQLSGESVTITERMFCAVDPRKGRDKVPTSLKDSREREEVADAEGNLVAFLVARKFGVVKQRVREFGGPESNDFDDVGAQIARSMGLRKVEILVEETPTLANKGTPNDGNLVERIENGDDGTFVTGGTGKDAGREVFWPRIAVAEPAASSEGPAQRKLTPYRFPVRFTFIDGRTLETRMPMFYCHELGVGGGLYPVAPDNLRAAPIHANMPLAAAQSAAAMNPEELGVDDAAKVFELLAGKKDETGKVVEIGLIEKLGEKDFISPPTEGGSKTLLESIRLSGITSALVGGMRERTLNYVAEQRTTIDEWFKKKNIESYNSFTAKLLGEPGFDENLVVRVITDSRAWIAWGKEGHVGVTAAQAARRLGEAVELAVKGGGVRELVAHLQTVESTRLTAEIGQQRIKVLSDLVTKVENLAKPEELRAFLPKLQAQWVASLGDIWHRSEWDKWFAGLFLEIQRDCWRGPANSLLQRELLHRLMKKGEAVATLFEGGQVPPLADWAPANLTLCRVPEALDQVFEKEIGSLKEELLEGKQTALRRLKQAVEDALPDELWLRQRVQMLIEDWPLAERAGKEGIDRLGVHLDGLLEEVGLHLTHLAAHSDAGMAPARRFFSRVEAQVEKVAKQLTTVEEEVRKWSEARAGKFTASLPVIKLPDKVADVPQVLKHVLQCDPDQSLRHFQNLLHECGGRLAVEIEEALLELVDLAKGTTEEVAGIEAQLKGWNTDLDLAVQSQYRRLAQRARKHQETLLAEIRWVVLPWRKTLESLIPDNDGAVVSPSVVGQVCAWLGELIPVGGQPAPLQMPLIQAINRLERALVGGWNVKKGDLDSAIGALDAHLERFDEETKKQIRAFKGKLEEFDAIQKIDKVEIYLAKLLGDGRESAKKQIQEVLEKLIAREALENLEKSWKEMRPHLVAIQNKLGQSLDNEVIGKIKKDFEKGIGIVQSEFEKALNSVNDSLKNRKEFLEGAALQLANKASISLAFPSLVKSFRDQSAKAEYFVEELRFTVKSLDGAASDLAGDVRAALGIPGIELVQARIPNVPGAQAIRHTGDYVTKGLRGLEKEAAGCFAEIAHSAKTLAQKSGVSDATARVKYLSRDLGSIADSVRKREAEVRDAWEKAKGDVEKFRETIKNPAKTLLPEASSFLPGSSAKLFGVIPLKDILAAVATPDKAPQLLANHLPDRIEQHYVWENELEERELKKIVHFKPHSTASKFRIVNTLTAWTPKPGQGVRQPEVFTRGHLDGFTLGIAGMLNLHFKSVAFTAKNGRFDFKPALGRAPGSEGEGFMTFTGPLELVDNVRKRISALLDSQGGPVVRLEDQRILAGYSFSVPELSFGIVTIQNLSIGTQLSLPLNQGSLAMRFNLSEFDKPFRVTVLCFGGGGFLAVQVSPDRKLCQVEGAIEFGGSLSLNLGVASGELSLMAGAYFKIAHNDTTFSGYLRAVGRVRVLGILEISILFYMALFYRRLGSGSESDTEFRGQCTVAVSVKLGFFKRTVRVSLERRFKGAKSNSNAAELSNTTPLTPENNSATTIFPHAFGIAEAGPSPSPLASLIMQASGTGPTSTPEDGYTSHVNHFTNEFAGEEDWSAYWSSFAA